MKKETISRHNHGSDDQSRVNNFRHQHQSAWPTPSVVDTLRFVNQEVGELDSVLMRQGYQDIDHVRNSASPKELDNATILEIGQVYMMLVTLANHFGICLSCALTQAFDHQQMKLQQYLTGLAALGQLTDEQRDLLAELSR